jgi:hypothetical protein
MKINNRVVLSLSNGVKKEFNTNIQLHEIKLKYAINKLFFGCFDTFSVFTIEAMTCFSVSDYERSEEMQIKNNMNFINRAIKN